MGATITPRQKPKQASRNLTQEIYIGGSCPALSVRVWPHGPTLPPTTASVVCRRVPRRDEKPLQKLGRNNGYGTGRHGRCPCSTCEHPPVVRAPPSSSSRAGCPS